MEAYGKGARPSTLPGVCVIYVDPLAQAYALDFGDDTGVLGRVANLSGTAQHINFAGQDVCSASLPWYQEMSISLKTCSMQARYTAKCLQQCTQGSLIGMPSPKS